jgi:hypothetical protein
MVVVQPLAADHDGWSCFSSSSAVWDCVRDDGACGNDNVGRLGLQRIAAGCLAWLGSSGAVQHRLTVQSTSLVSWFVNGGFMQGRCNEAKSVRDVGLAT